MANLRNVIDGKRQPSRAGADLRSRPSIGMYAYPGAKRPTGGGRGGGAAGSALDPLENNIRNKPCEANSVPRRWLAVVEGTAGEIDRVALRSANRTRGRLVEVA